MYFPAAIQDLDRLAGYGREAHDGQEVAMSGHGHGYNRLAVCGDQGLQEDWVARRRPQEGRSTPECASGQLDQPQLRGAPGPVAIGVEAVDRLVAPAPEVGQVAAVI